MKNENTIKAEEFDPSAYVRDVVNENGQSIGKTLDVKYRKLWFRTAYPNGKIEQIIHTLDAQIAVVEARVYADKTDAEGTFLSNAYAQRNYDPATEYGTAYLECAATAAVGRALADAGFGTQFCVEPEEADPKPVDSPVTGQTSKPTETSKTIEPSEPFNSAKDIMEFNEQTPLDVIVQKMPYEEAVKLILNSGKHKGKTLGMVAVEDYQYVQWIAENYKGGNLLKGAANVVCKRHEQGGAV